MALPLRFPHVKYVPRLARDGATPLDELCNRAEARCEAVGAWTKRPVVIVEAGAAEPWIRAEPGDWGAVEIGVPPISNELRRARWVLGALAFSALFDQVARATVAGKEWARIEKPRGPSPKLRRPLSTTERQQRFRSRASIAG